MRCLANIGVLLAAVVLVACGGGGSSSGPSEKPQTAMSKSEIAKLTAPRVKAPSGPLPTELVVNDLREGSGATLKPGDQLVVDDVGISYRSGEEFETTWGKEGRPSRFPLNEVIEGWEKGLPGMKVGGRRELIVPSKMAYGQGPVIYVVDLLAIE
jgi:peptidylprolyl isomerase